VSDQTAADSATRKRDHLRLALGAEVGFATMRTGLDELRVRARALPEHDLDEVDLSRELWGRRLAAPLLISCMTGGVGEAGPVNRALATAAQRHRVALGLGSGRILLERPGSAADSFAVRDLGPDVLLFANLGAVQLHRYGPSDCARLVASCQADALVLHLNAVQEAVQPGGDTQFGGLLARIAALCAQLDVPVLVKEVGFGLAPQDVRALADVGVAGVDVAGAGGTNWARLEGLRDDQAAAVAAAFVDWGWATVDSLRAARAVLGDEDLVVIGSGGLRHGVDAFKVLCLGAGLAGVARGLLGAAAHGPQAAVDAVGVLVRQLRIAAWASGVSRLSDIGPHLLQP
jgi:isopentenyl-diphosphate delta-isomerase